MDAQWRVSPSPSEYNHKLRPRLAGHWLSPHDTVLTSSIAEIDSCGRLKIVDRIKNVVKLSQGEYVALEKLEGMYALNPLFASLLVHGDSTRSSLVAVAVLDPERAAQLVNRTLGKALSAGDVQQLEQAVQDKQVRASVMKGLGRVAAQNKLNGFVVLTVCRSVGFG